MGPYWGKIRLEKGRQSLSLLANFWKLITFIGGEQISRILLVLVCLFENLMVYYYNPEQLTSSSFIT